MPYPIMHEMLHVAGLGGGWQIEQALGINPEVVKSVGTSAITFALMGACGQ